MRDQHRPKQDLINEVVALRKQVADLRELLRSPTMAGRQRPDLAGGAWKHQDPLNDYFLAG